VQDVKELCSRMAIINMGRLLYAGPPEDALRSMDGRVWEKKIPKAELERYTNDFQLISSKLVAGRPIIHVMSEQKPEDGFVQAEASLEDVFFSKLYADQRGNAVVV